MAVPQLNAYEARVLGVLIEKSLTTPDQYPLSLNAATAGSNQKSNRDPVTDYLEAEVDVALQGLIIKHLAGKVVPGGSRVEKFRHNAAETLGLDAGHLAVLAELMMRGPQQPGELRGRVHRMAPTPALGDLSGRLERLIADGFVRRLPPAPGTRAERYAQLMCTDTHPVDAAAPVATPGPSTPEPATPEPAPPHPVAATAVPTGGLEGRVAALEAEVRALRAELEALRATS